ncbi:Uma2 family endonuclease [Crocosphaera sp.]|uniref:Uma2 family endonuclease n=1 Tax=Crocosphaera sp. TaxID=2729996 RepID=UPI002623E1EF|nr:Uma2 family endonuclease [Crocosphaera sp.]MDJ0583028.1 Uma2 family endonuclease [Crocosphaera sp.]
MVSFLDVDEDLLFPDSDGQPMADNTEQYEWVVKIKENLEIIFVYNPNVFIAGDLLWYPLKSTLVGPVAPDVMVAYGRPKGRRGSYRQWREENIAPQVVFEILSPSNTKAEMTRKLEFYDRYGVEEYYLYAPDRLRFQGWQRKVEDLKEIIPINNWISPRLGIRFVIDASGLEIYGPDGKKFLTSIELNQQIEEEKQEIEIQRERAESEKQRADRLAQKLRELGVDLEEESINLGVNIS